MYKQIVTAVTAALVSTSAFAQENHGSHNPAVKDPSARHIAAPANGANSFTETQAQGRIAKAGYAQVSRLRKDRNGVWQGTALKNRHRVHVALDYKGNVSAR